ncbi:MAG: sigma-70 family RNA polymerase sigma factor [Planctomycetota bacterium]
MTKRSLLMLRPLAEQLKHGPQSLRLPQLLQIDFLLSLVETDREYSLNFITETLVGGHSARPGGAPRALLSGRRLIPELAALAEELSENAQLAPTQWPETLSEIPDLARRLQVSAKTVRRWQGRGLVAWRFRGPNARSRLVFPEHCVQRFVGQNLALVRRARDFSQLPTTEREEIVARAIELAKSGKRTLNAIAKVIAPQIGRAVETVRRILKQHDNAHPRTPILAHGAPLSGAADQALAIWEAHAQGAALAVLARRFNQPPGRILSTITQVRARKLKMQAIQFVDHPDFAAPGAEEQILDPRFAGPLRQQQTVAVSRVPRTLPPYLASLFRTPLLTPEGERVLFRKMNYLKYRAHALVQQLDPASAVPAVLDRIEALLDQAVRVRNEIAQANLRLVVSIAKKRATAGHDLFELISEGNVALLRAVEKFDCSRGFRFSTYASWAILNGYTRPSLDRRPRRLREQQNTGDWQDVADIRPAEEPDAERVQELRGAVSRMLAQLDERERAIVRGRYGLGDEGGPQTLEQIGQRLGISKERVRQLQAKALLTLRAHCPAAAIRLIGA